MTEFDARALNWRFVVPDEPDGLLLLPVRDESLPGARVVEPTRSGLTRALARAPYPAVAAPDLTSSAAVHTRGRTRTLLRLLAGAVGSEGWLCVGVANAWYPGSWFSRRGLRPSAARRILSAGGFLPAETYLALPDQRCPAFLVRERSGAELDYLLRRQFLPYAGDLRGVRARVRVLMLRVARRIALLMPGAARSAFAPAVVLVARRSR